MNFFFTVETVEQAITNNQQEQAQLEQPSSPTSVATPTSTNSGNTSNAAPTFSYDDLFPALPANTAAPLSSNAAPSCVRVTTTQKTQVSIKTERT